MPGAGQGKIVLFVRYALQMPTAIDMYRRDGNPEVSGRTFLEGYMTGDQAEICGELIPRNSSRTT
ncbi:hypothetical protein QR77_03435 [Streptomyces sp. 150FB]|nr:hypothetical protein QR77_03435 [Streptomyces sp. 150FB]